MSAAIAATSTPPSGASGACTTRTPKRWRRDSRYFATEVPAAWLRLGFAETADAAELVEGVRRLARV
ncbi:hypothetical protein ACIBO2_56010 [Nonomuraea sp. NPDC050022]|uniref:hypothetical protein n=1 Tax=unclassified Nonomuraea TaxID=2593643 RepID=UPI0033FCC408